MQHLRVDVDANATQIEVRSAAGDNAIDVQHAALDAVAAAALPGAVYEGSTAYVLPARVMVSREYFFNGAIWFEMSISTAGRILIERKGKGKGVPVAVPKAKAKAKGRGRGGGPY